jgi:hypothetical protein
MRQLRDTCDGGLSHEKPHKTKENSAKAGVANDETEQLVSNLSQRCTEAATITALDPCAGIRSLPPRCK